MADIDELRKNDYFIAEIDGLKCPNLESFLKQIGIAYKFPEYYGNNMNALWDCLCDLSWLNQENYALIIKNADSFLIDERKEIKSDILSFFLRVADDWRNVPNYPGEDKYRNRSDFILLLI